jgi:dTDP-4-dehydrorhamnose 3,5-epimerase-like enzyme
MIRRQAGGLPRMSDWPGIIEGGLYVDNRGSLAFFNEFTFSGVERFYIIRPEEPNAVRGWIGHQREQKWFTAAEGTIAVAVVRPNDWQSPDRNVPVSKFVLSADKPRILSVPPGHATAIIGISAKSALMVFSSGAMDQASSDTYRFPPNFWAIPERDAEAQCASF